MDELKQALEQQKLNGLEEDFIEVLCRSLNLSRETVARIAYAYEMLRLQARDFTVTYPVEDWYELLPNEELRDAIRYAMLVGATNVAITRAIRLGESLSVNVGLLIPPNDKASICRGCPVSFECIAESLSTPDKCYDGDKSRPGVYPLKVVGKNVIVECRQPAGKFTIPLEALYRERWTWRK